MRCSWSGLLAVVLVAMLYCSTPVRCQEVSDTKEELLEALAKNDKEGDKDGSVNMNDERFLFGSYQTTTYTVVSASTSTVFYSCLSGTFTSLCQGRRKRKSLDVMQEMPDTEATGLDLDGSLDQDGVLGKLTEEDRLDDARDKFALTVWTTSKTTTSITVYYTNTSSTVRVSYYCVAGNLRTPTFDC